MINRDDWVRENLSTFRNVTECKTMLDRLDRREDITNGILYPVIDASLFVTGTDPLINGGLTAW